jgi:clan AA aspartic protease (TIGR02281 family)
MRLPLALLLLLGLGAPPASAEIYRWSDETGTHFTQDLGQVPPKYRRQAEEAAKKGPSPTPRVVWSSGPAPAARNEAPAPAGQAGRTHRVGVERAGSSLLVMVRLDDRVDAPFLIDTGASDVLVPLGVAKQLGIDTGAARTKRYATANGVVEHPVVTLRSVSLGGARVENVPASVSPNMNVGLLGLSFFNHFTYNIDAAQGIVTLTRNDLAASGGIRGGRSEAQWRAEYASMRARIGQVEREYETKSSHKSQERRRLEEQRQELERQLALLDEEADRARVPMAWRQ